MVRILISGRPEEVGRLIEWLRQVDGIDIGDERLANYTPKTQKGTWILDVELDFGDVPQPNGRKQR